MKPSHEHTPHYVNSRVLKINVGFLLSDGPGHSRDITFDVPAMRVSEDVTLQYLKGEVRISRTTEGLLLQGNFTGGVEDECTRCLDTVERAIEIGIEELVAYPTPIGTEFTVSDDGILDLAPLIRAEVLIEAGRGVLCRPDCKGLCPECGTNLNHDTCHCHEENVDPRMAKLKQLLKSSD
ncbi:MAG: DUF177 domain-containing protein [Anaerolineae bacterium]